MNHYCDIWYWRASDQEAVARNLTDRGRTTGVPNTAPRAGLARTALQSVLRTAGLMEQPVEASPVGQEFQYREAVLDEGEWVLRCPECGHLDRLLWLSEESRALLVGLARRRWRVRVRRA